LQNKDGFIPRWISDWRFWIEESFTGLASRQFHQLHLQAKLVLLFLGKEPLPQEGGRQDAYPRRRNILL